MRKFLVIVEEGEDNFSAYSPELPGCVATGSTYDETLQNMYEAIQFHIEALKEDGLEIPYSTSSAAYIAIPEPVAS
jgi:predicted RNase H-like HicB family nuclease